MEFKLQEKYGFIYIWYDRKRKMFYIGSHWGTETDGYVCSSNRMRDAHRRRPQDFKRRILLKLTDRKMIFIEEEKWLQKVKNKTRYYNLRFETAHWTTNENSKSIGQKISESKKGFKHSEATKKKMSERFSGEKNPFYGKKWGDNHPRGMLGKTQSEESKKKMSETLKNKEDWISPEMRRQTGDINKLKMKLLWQDPEYRKHMSEVHKGQIAWNRGKPTSDATKQKILTTKKLVSPEMRRQTGDKIRLKMKNLWQDPEYKKRMSESHKGKIPWNKGKPISDASKQKMILTKKKNKLARISLT